MARDIILHCHFFKNAGSTIDWALRRCFLNSFYEHHGELSIQEWNKYLEKITADPKIQIVTSHFFTFPPAPISNINLHPIAMLRHPIERVSSVAYFDKKRNYRLSKNIIRDTNISIRGYIKAYLRDGTPASIRNMHTLRFAGDDRGSPPATKKDFQRAIDYIKRSKNIGLLEAFDESMVLFEENLRPIFPTLDLSYIIQNAHQKRQTEQQKISNLRMQIGEELFEILLVKNTYDLKLYKNTKKLFLKRIGEIDNFPQKLHDFRERCRNLLVS